MKTFEKGSDTWWDYAEKAILETYRAACVSDDGVSVQELADEKKQIVGDILLKQQKKTVTNIELYQIMDEIREGKHEDVATL